MISTLQKVECVGCGACSHACPTHCIDMKWDAEGFLYPHISKEKCIECNKCERACPVLSTQTVPTTTLPKSYVAWTTNNTDLMAATSGGIFTAIARKVLEDGGAVVGAAYDQNHVVRHIVVESISELHHLSRSKFSQSIMGDVYEQIAKLLKNDRKVLFCGTACQVYAVDSYCRANNINTANLMLIDLVCKGVPTPRLLSEYVNWVEQRAHSKVSTIAMRERVAHGSFGSASFTRLDFKNGKTSLRNTVYDPFGYFFYNEFAMRASCHQCPFKTINRISDLTIGDCWFSACLTDDSVPYEVTLCLAQSETGQHLLDSTPSIEYKPVHTIDAVKCNGGMIYQSSSPNPNRDAFLAALGNESFDAIVKKYLPFSVTRIIKRFRARIKPTLQRFADKTVATRARRLQDHEYRQRMQRTIPSEATSKRVRI